MIRPFALPAALLAGTAHLAGTQAAALSCSMPDPVRTYLDYLEEGGDFAVLHGNLFFDVSLLPLKGPTDGPGPGGDTEMPPIPALFDGAVLGPAGPMGTAPPALLLQPVCFGQYCGYASEGPHVLFARTTPDGHVVRLGLCGGTVFEPDPDTLARLGACLRGEDCVAPPPEDF